MSSSDFFRKFQPLFEAADPKDDKKKLQDPPKEVKIDKDLTKKGYGKQGKATNVKENSADFFRKYSDIIKEAEEQIEEVKEEDEDKEEVAESDDPFDKNYKDPGDKEEKSKKVAGKAYGGSKQDDDNKDEPWYAKKDPDAKSKKKSKLKESSDDFSDIKSWQMACKSQFPGCTFNKGREFITARHNGQQVGEFDPDGLMFGRPHGTIFNSSAMSNPDNMSKAAHGREFPPMTPNDRAGVKAMGKKRFKRD
jgi:hypothetical protein